MRIGVYDPYLDTMSGGEKYMLTAAECLAKDHDVTIFWDNAAEIQQLAEKRFGFNLRKFEFAPNIFSPRTNLLDRMVATRKYDVVLLLSDGSIPIISCPLIVHFQSPLPWVNGRTLKNKVKMSLVHAVICNSKFTKSFIDNTFHIDSHVLYPPVEINTQLEAKKENIILNVGRFGIQQSGSSFKKQDILAEIFVRMVKNGIKGWKLVFVMNVSEKDLEKAHEFKMKYSKYPIHFHLNQPNDTVWEMYQKAKIYWHAAGFGENVTLHPDRAEHFGMSTVEAMGAGAVPIVYGAGGQVEIVNSPEVGIIWNTEEELIAKTLEVMKDNRKWEDVSSGARGRASDFSKEKFCSTLYKILP